MSIMKSTMLTLNRISFTVSNNHDSNGDDDHDNDNDDDDDNDDASVDSDQALRPASSSGVGRPQAQASARATDRRTVGGGSDERRRIYPADGLEELRSSQRRP